MNKKEYKSRMSAEARARRRAEVGEAASEKISKSEQLNFRISESAIKELQDLAYSRKLPISTMVHDWVLERLAQERLGKSEVSGKALQLLKNIHFKLQYFFDSKEAKNARAK